MSPFLYQHVVTNKTFDLVPLAQRKCWRLGNCFVPIEWQAAQVMNLECAAIYRKVLLALQEQQIVLQGLTATVEMQWWWMAIQRQTVLQDWTTHWRLRTSVRRMLVASVVWQMEVFLGMRIMTTSAGMRMFVEVAVLARMGLFARGLMYEPAAWTASPANSRCASCTTGKKGTHWDLGSHHVGEDSQVVSTLINLIVVAMQKNQAKEKMPHIVLVAPNLSAQAVTNSTILQTCPMVGYQFPMDHHRQQHHQTWEAP